MMQQSNKIKVGNKARDIGYEVAVRMDEGIENLKWVISNI